ncbi:DUF4232 domain-containing protein [Streptomyces fulvorobeus]|uniref:DUF4232 domain-containing protein n=1 Tax=Streptomyces fulvorobeus TaxID=284028 RepID=A0A7J0BZM9_9ACTN|nr:DUF4232 domain-containing protein [Streptomyces fulvorobeus]NYE39486.1 hypothetical protein [Streptomyces fulvorobeus]GFM95720.1 hypothetical protein Sfulv_05310 [Streptomyces fulvorobeus]
MRIRPALAASFTAVLALLATSGAPAAATPGPAVCAERAVEVAAAASSAAPDVVLISVTNQGHRPCAVDRIPTVNFGDLDGAALPVPETSSAPYRLAAGGSAYAAVRTLDPASTELRLVDAVTVAGHPAHRGRTFEAASLAAPDGIRVWEPVTTWWHPTRAGADAVLARHTG